MSKLRNFIRPLPGVRWAAKQMRLLRANKELRHFAALSANERPDMPVRMEDRCFYLMDRTIATPFDAHYLYHTAWAIRQLKRLQPKEHVDISSSLNFVGLASAITPILHLDFRPPDFKMDNVTCGAGDLHSLPFQDASVSSLSCMHVIEHIGLGRYGDPLDARGDLKAAAELQRILAVGGHFLFVTPVGRPRVSFNAHRIYSFEMVKALFPLLHLEGYSLLEDDTKKGLIQNPAPELINRQSYGCGCFLFSKLTA